MPPRTGATLEARRRYADASAEASTQQQRPRLKDAKRMPAQGRRVKHANESRMPPQTQANQTARATKQANEIHPHCL
ncbi:hypothetical protein PTKU46_59580 [Paraburkholderia terrae]